jgi:hypothetical protein
MVAVLVGMGLVFRFFPRKGEEEALRASYHAQDQGEEPGAPPAPPIRVPAPGEGPAIPGYVSPDELG